MNDESYKKQIVATEVGHQDLELLGSIKPGDTVCVHSLAIVKHSSWSTSFWRTFYDENRLKTIAWVGNVVSFVMKLICENAAYNSSGGIFHDKIWRMKTGIENLSETYKDDLRCLKYLKQYQNIVSSMIFETNHLILKYKEEKEKIHNTNHTKPIQIQKEVSEFVIVDSTTMSMPEYHSTNQLQIGMAATSVTPYNYFLVDPNKERNLSWEE